MKRNNIFILFGLLALLGSCVIAQRTITLEELRNMGKKKESKTKRTGGESAEVPPPTPKRVERRELEILASGQQSPVEEPFIYIARTREDLRTIGGMAGGIEFPKDLDLTRQAVVAAFAGLRNTGGYAVSIYRVGSVTHVDVKKPPKDAFVTQALTQPYAVAVVPLEEEASLELALADDFKNGLQTYRVTSGEFEFSGGLMGILKRFAPQGTISVMRHEGHATFLFDLEGTGEDSSRKLSEMASGAGGESSVTLNRLEAGGFIDRPHPPLVVDVKFRDGKLTMKFEPGKREYVVNDGYEGRGHLEAVRQN